MTRRNLLSAMLAPAALREVRVAALPPLPESIAGQFAGVHAGRLIVAGGYPRRAARVLSIQGLTE